MSARPWMPLYVGDYLADTAHLRAIEHGAYLLLIMHYWRTGGLPDEDLALARITRTSKAEWNRIRPIVALFFQDGWKHKRIEFELTEAARMSSAGRAGGKASGEARRTKPQRSTNDQRTTDERSFNDMPNDQRTISEALHSPSQRKKDAADAALPGFEKPPPSDLERQLFDRGKEVAGKDAGGLIAKLLKAKKGDVALARAAVELASTKQDPREFLGAVVAGGKASLEGRRLTNDEEYWGVGRTPGII